MASHRNTVIVSPTIPYLLSIFLYNLPSASLVPTVWFSRHLQELLDISLELHKQPIGYCIIHDYQDPNQ